MTRKVSSPDAELRYLRKILPVIARHVEAAGIPFMRGRYIRELRDVVQLGRLGSWRLLRIHLMGELPALSERDRERLDADLQQRAGVSLQRVEAPFLAKVAEILERGRIYTKGQYEILWCRATHLEPGGPHDQERRAIRRLVAEYAARVELVGFHGLPVVMELADDDGHVHLPGEPRSELR